jgi:hypothetical protein
MFFFPLKCYGRRSTTLICHQRQRFFSRHTRVVFIVARAFNDSRGWQSSPAVGFPDIATFATAAVWMAPSCDARAGNNSQSLRISCQEREGVSPLSVKKIHLSNTSGQCLAPALIYRAAPTNTHAYIRGNYAKVRGGWLSSPPISAECNSRGAAARPLRLLPLLDAQVSSHRSPCRPGLLMYRRRDTVMPVIIRITHSRTAPRHPGPGGSGGS